MTDPPPPVLRWLQFALATLITIGFAVIVVWIAQSYGRTVGFAFGVNWILMAWALLLGRVLESPSGAWNYPVLSMRQIRARLDRPSNRLQPTVMDEVPRREGQGGAAETGR